jgi:hypothetical protein
MARMLGAILSAPFQEGSRLGKRLGRITTKSSKMDKILHRNQEFFHSNTQQAIHTRHKTSQIQFRKPFLKLYICKRIYSQAHHSYLRIFIQLMYVPAPSIYQLSCTPILPVHPSIPSLLKSNFPEQKYIPSQSFCALLNAISSISDR